MRECFQEFAQSNLTISLIVQHVASSGQHSIAIRFVGKPWEELRGVPVDREGEFVFSLRPRSEKYSNRLLCEVKVQDNVKVVIIRSNLQD